jgi:GT2 family glycosyltransferase
MKKFTRPEAGKHYVKRTVTTPVIIAGEDPDGHGNRALSRHAPAKVYIVLVNWNGWHDTVECLESVFRSSYENYQVVVCDNHSDDNSWNQLQAWTLGQLTVPLADHLRLPQGKRSPVPKPIPYVTYDRTAAEAGGDHRADAARLILIQTGGNLGFSGGNNVALRFALRRNDMDYVWLLNNDTIVTPHALSALVQRLQQRPEAGLCGSTLLSYSTPDMVQTRGGMTYNRWLATMAPLGRGQSVHARFDHARVERLMDYVAGASTLVTRRFLETVGLLSESYFLYCEELDWATRAGRRFKIAYSPESLVYHKEGQSVRATGDERFNVADYYIHRSRLRYTRRFFPIALPAVVIRTLAAALARLWRGQPRRAWTILRLVLARETYALAKDG